MAAALVGSYVFFELWVFRDRKCPVQESLSDVVDSLGGRMAHVLGVEAVIAELIHHDLV